MIAYSTDKRALTNLELSHDFQPIIFSDFEILAPFPARAGLEVRSVLLVDITHLRVLQVI